MIAVTDNSILRGDCMITKTDIEALPAARRLSFEQGISFDTIIEEVAMLLAIRDGVLIDAIEADHRRLLYIGRSFTIAFLSQSKLVAVAMTSF
jgi:hypothetical protein